MAHIVLETVAEKDEKKRPSTKEPRPSSQERKEDMKDKMDQERERAKEADTAKRRLRIIATQKCKTDAETTAALAQIEAMSPQEAIQKLDLFLARADASFVDRIAGQIRTGFGTIVDFLVNADGCVAQRFEADQTLQNALVSEFGFAASFINVKMQIAMCVASDTILGWKDSSATKKLVRITAITDVKEKEKEKECPK